MRKQYPLLVLILGIGLTTVTPAHAFDWANLWSSAEQRAARQLENQQYDELINNAPDANWRGLGEYRKGDFAAAAKSFEQLRGQAEESGLATEAGRAMYNQANAHIYEENYQAAINLFDELLESDPQHVNAKHNRDIAQQLLEQQQQQQEQQQQESGEQGEQGDENQSESEDQKDQQDQQQDQQSGEGEQSENQNDEQGEDQQQTDQSSEQSSDNNSQSSDNETEAQAESDAQEQAEKDAAAAAMQAERERQAEAQQTENAANAESAEAAAPLTEREQANEQWLRQIPDDPAGLLERKIHNRHLTDFPKVLDSDKPW